MSNNPYNLPRTAHFCLVPDTPVGDFEGKLIDLISRLTDLLKTVPEEHRDKVEINIMSGYDGDPYEYDISYSRKLTDTELAEATAREKRRRDKLKEQREEQKAKSEREEKALYRRLKKKYEKSS